LPSDKKLYALSETTRIILAFNSTSYDGQEFILISFMILSFVFDSCTLSDGVRGDGRQEEVKGTDTRHSHTHSDGVKRRAVRLPVMDMRSGPSLSLARTRGLW
jgi:hypothetical protein